MKKIAKMLALVLVLTLVLSLAACSKDEIKDTTAPAPNANANANANIKDNLEVNANVNNNVDSKEEADSHEEVPAPENVDSGSLVGSWKTSLPFGRMMEASSDPENPEDVEMMGLLGGMMDMEVVMYMRLGADNKIAFDIDENSAKEISQGMVSIMPAMIAAELGTDQESLEAMLAEEGKTLDDLMMEFLGEDTQSAAEMIADNMLNSEKPDANYTVEGDKLTIQGVEGAGDTTMTFTVSGNTMTVTEIVGDDADLVLFKDQLPWTLTKVN